MISIGENELQGLPRLGETIICPHCGKMHKVKYADRVLDNGEKVKDKTLAFITCKGNDYLIGIDGVDITSDSK